MGGGEQRQQGAWTPSTPLARMQWHSQCIAYPLGGPQAHAEDVCMRSSRANSNATATSLPVPKARGVKPNLRGMPQREGIDPHNQQRSHECGKECWSHRGSSPAQVD